MKKLILFILLIGLVFYHIYPQGMPVLGYTFIVGSGAVGLLLYIIHRYPFGEVVTIALSFMLLIVWYYFCVFINDRSDSYMLDVSKTQLGWFFSAYLIINVFYTLHPKGGLQYLLYYIIGAIFLQCVISVAMSQDPAIASFFNSFQKLDSLGTQKRDETEGQRLLGYGTAFFGAGIAAGVGLIFLSYLLMVKKMNLLQIFFFSFIYSSIFYVGLLSARTTLVGAAASIILIITLLFTKKSHKGQILPYLFFCIILLSIGYTLCYLYYPEFADWAFEAFINYRDSGELTTKSSSGLERMFMIPDNLSTWIFGRAYGLYWGTDVGFTRLLFWIGLPGTLIFFYYLYVSMKFSFSKDNSFNLTLLTLYAYNIALNLKGISDLNYISFIITFYFLYYKYYIYTPYLYRLGKFNQTKLRNAIQTPPPSGRVQSDV